MLSPELQALKELALKASPYGAFDAGPMRTLIEATPAEFYKLVLSLLEKLGQATARAEQAESRLSAAEATVAAVVKAAKAFHDKCRQLEPAIDDAFGFKAIHGLPYAGPTWAAEFLALDRVLFELRPTTPEPQEGT